MGKRGPEPLNFQGRFVPENMRPYAYFATLLTAKQVATILGLKYQSFLTLRSRDPDRFPKPVQIGGVLRWRADDFNAWVAALPQVG